MLHIIIPEREFYDETTNTFFKTKPQELNLEHSLISISKWESKIKKPFMTDEKKTAEEMLEYIKCMTINGNVPDETYNLLTKQNIDDITNYMNDPMTATTFKNTKKRAGKKIITSEEIYYFMTALNIPFECEKWHVNRLLTLIQVCSIKSSPNKKMGKSEIARQNRELNAARRAKLNTPG